MFVPPKHKALVLLAPQPPDLLLIRFKSASSVHDVPLKDSFNAPVPGFAGVEVDPPKTKADVVVPAPGIIYLAVFKSLTSVQLVPSYNSVAPVVGDVPPTYKDAVCVPALDGAPCCLPVFKFPPVDHAPTGWPGPNHSSVAPVVVGVVPPNASAAL